MTNTESAEIFFLTLTLLWVPAVMYEARAKGRAQCDKLRLELITKEDCVTNRVNARGIKNL